MPKPDYTIVICTLARPDALANTLASIAGCQAQDIAFEVLVVDNGPDAGTARIAQEFAERLPLRYTVAADPGLSRARNHGIREALGAWLIWCDDDVLVDPGWLAAYAAAVASHPGVAVMGGTVQPRLLGDADGWLSRGVHFVGDAYGARMSDRFRGPIHADGPKPYGCNFACRRDIAARFLFDETLGRHPDHPTRGGEELDLIRRVLNHRHSGYWVPGATLQHLIPRERQTEAYLRDYFRESGRVAAARAARHQSTLVRLGLGLRSFARGTAHRLVYWWHRHDYERARRARNLREMSWHGGYVTGWWQAFNGGLGRSAP